MAETLIPTMNFRWRAPSPQALSAQPNCAVLEQMFEKPGGGRTWKPVPWHFEWPDGMAGNDAP